MLTPAELRRAADLIESQDPFGRFRHECADLARKLREEAEGRGWRSMDTAPTSGVVLLAVAGGGERKTFVAEQSVNGNTGEWYWMITVGWAGWTRLHSHWALIGWQPLPPGPEA